MSDRARRAPWRREFQPVASAVRAVREFVLATPPAADVDAERLELAVSELATNAVLHARTPFEVSVHALDDGVRVEIADGDERIPRPGSGDPSSVTGRGLFIVASIVDRWAVNPTPPGKTVWFELRTLSP